MTPEQKVVSQPTAERLRLAGFPQDTEREWQVGGKLSGPTESKLLYKKRPTTYSTADSAWSYYAAPDATELGELLPEFIHADDGSWSYGQRKERGMTNVFYWNPSGTKKAFEFFSNEAEARAACWQWLKEQKLI